MIRSKIGPLSEDCFEGDPVFNPDVERAYSPASNERMRALRQRLSDAKKAAVGGFQIVH
jgi:hypothetical protein